MLYIYTFNSISWLYIHFLMAVILLLHIHYHTIYILMLYDIYIFINSLDRFTYSWIILTDLHNYYHAYVHTLKQQNLFSQKTSRFPSPEFVLGGHIKSCIEWSLPDLPVWKVIKWRFKWVWWFLTKLKCENVWKVISKCLSRDIYSKVISFESCLFLEYTYYVFLWVHI